MIRVWLDDERPTPNGWIRVKTPEEAIRLLETHEVEVISLDHDLGLDETRTGYTVLNWLEFQVFTDKAFRMPKVLIHTDNPVGRKNMLAALNSIYSRIETHGAPKI